MKTSFAGQQVVFCSTAGFCLLVLASLSGCVMPEHGDRRSELEATLLKEKIKSCPEAVTGKFKTLVDFEFEEGPLQAEQFSVEPSRPETSLRFVTGQARTGSGSITAVLEKGDSLHFKTFKPVDLSGHSLIAMAIHVSRPRDDLVVTLDSASGSRKLPPGLIRPGWNQVYIDIVQSPEWKDFDAKKLTGLRLKFIAAAGPVTFMLDDILLVDNRREITPVPEGIKLQRTGLNYCISVEGEEKPLSFTRRRDGLWKLDGQTNITFVAAGDNIKIDGVSKARFEYLADHRIGELQLIEHSPVRLRISNSWFFPPRPGEWYVPAVRYLTRDYIWYGGGRRVAHIKLNNAGGRTISEVHIRSQLAAWKGFGEVDRLDDIDFVGPLASWTYLFQPPSDSKGLWRRNYLNPGKLQKLISRPDVFAKGDADRDGFDESQGCYCLAAENGHCRFKFLPPPGGLGRPAVRVLGPWKGAVSVNVEGLSISPVIPLDDGSIIFIMPDNIVRPTAVEVTERGR